MVSQSISVHGQISTCWWLNAFSKQYPNIIPLTGGTENVKGLIDRPTPGNLTANQQARVTAVTLAMEMDQKSGAFGQKLQENLSLAAGGAFPGDPLDNEQAFAVKCALKEAKEAETPGQLSIWVKAKIAGGIVANLSDMPPGAEKIGDALTAIDSLQF